MERKDKQGREGDRKRGATGQDSGKNKYSVLPLLIPDQLGQSVGWEGAGRHAVPSLVISTPRYYLIFPIKKERTSPRLGCLAVLLSTVAWLDWANLEEAQKVDGRARTTAKVNGKLDSYALKCEYKIKISDRGTGHAALATQWEELTKSRRREGAWLELVRGRKVPLNRLGSGSITTTRATRLFYR